MKSDAVSLKILSWQTRAVYLLEQVLAHALVPLAFLIMVLRSRKEPAHFKNLSDRFGFGVVKHRKPIWIYAASLGETRAASPLIRRLRSAGYMVLLTHQSPAGHAEGARLFGDDDGVTQSFIPLDLFWAVRMFLRRFQPVALIVMEIEIWPAMLMETARKGIPIAMANGNLLERSMGNGAGPRSHMLKLYHLFSHIFTRTDVYQDRYIRIGVSPSRISVVGEMKFDQLVDPRHLVMAKRLRANLVGGQRVFMIASSVEAEEQLLLPMVERLLSKDAALRVLWAPRSPQRFQAVVEALSSKGISVTQRSSLGPDMDGPMPDVQVIVGDSIGEMDAYYPVADLVFVGASFVDHGGHNIIEPLGLGRPVVMGPSTFGIDFAAELAAQTGAFESLPDVADLENRVSQLLADASALKRMSAAAVAFSADKNGAAGRTFAGLLPLLGPPAQSAHR
jgi:3-deoxy-D-manno-octulosonic-acid transferase